MEADERPAWEHNCIPHLEVNIIGYTRNFDFFELVLQSLSKGLQGVRNPQKQPNFTSYSQVYETNYGFWQMTCLELHNDYQDWMAERSKAPD